LKEAIMRRSELLLAACFLSACVTLPEGPSVLVLPGGDKSFEQFRQDDALCRQYAAERTGASAQDAATQSALTGAAVGAGIGAVAGAAIGGRHGAGVGAGTGLVVGGVTGAGTSQVSAHEAQRRYDNAFVQCMYARGHRVPVSGHYVPPPTPAAPASPPYPPPPPSH
jgi:hypothetical protein